jgi:hypothetical protein
MTVVDIIRAINSPQASASTVLRPCAFSRARNEPGESCQSTKENLSGTWLNTSG